MYMLLEDRVSENWPKSTLQHITLISNGYNNMIVDQILMDYVASSVLRDATLRRIAPCGDT